MDALNYLFYQMKQCVYYLNLSSFVQPISLSCGDHIDSTIKIYYLKYLKIYPMQKNGLHMNYELKFYHNGISKILQKIKLNSTSKSILNIVLRDMIYVSRLA